MQVNGDNDHRLTEGIKELLQTLPEDTLKAFLNTVTGHLVRYGSVPLDKDGKPTMDSRTHAIQTILMYSNPYDLLVRQKMTKAVLSDYLNQKRVRMTEPFTKHTLIKDVLRYWGVESPTNLTIRDFDRSQNAIKNEPNSQSQVPSASSSTLTQTAHSSNSAIPTSSATAPQSQSALASRNSAGGANSGNAIIAENNNELETMEYENYSAIQRQEAEVGYELGKEFSTWFYERLNTLCDFSPAHFWQECNLRLEMILAAYADNTVIDEIIGNGDASCAKLKDLVAVKQLFFNPSPPETGVRGYLSPHGLAKVMVCGVLHEKSTGAPVGVFEQMFGLMRDPRAGNTFKIRFTLLRLREGTHLSIQDRPPEILDSSLVGIIEEVD